VLQIHTFCNRLLFYLVVILTFLKIKILVPMVRISPAETHVKNMGNSQHIHIRKHAKPDCTGERGSTGW